MLGFVVALSTTAHADDTEAARQHYEAGSKAFDLGEFPRAIREYRAAYEAKPDPALLYNIAQAYRLSNELPNALFFYKSYLRKSPNPAERVELERRIRDLEAQIEKQKQLATAPPVATIQPPTLPTSTARDTPPPLPVRSSPVNQTDATPPPLTAYPTATTPTAATTPAPMTVTSSPPASTKTPIYKKWWLWTIVGVAAAGVVVGAAVGATAGSSGAAEPASHFGTSSVF